MIKQLGFSLMTIATLAGCCTNVTRDPREGGLVGGVCGTTSGSYQRRIDEREASLAGLREEKARQEERHTSLTAEEAAARRDLSAAQSDLNALRRKVNAASATTAAQRSKQRELAQALDRKQAELRQLQSQSLTASQQRQRIAELDAEVRTLAELAVDAGL